MRLNSLIAFALLTLANAVAEVSLLRTPNGGIQPQIAIASDGTVHLIYYKGDDRAGNIFYVCQKAGGVAFSEPIRVNSQTGSAIAVGTIRGAQLALGKGDRPHVIWNGGSGAAKTKLRGEEITPLLYARMNDAGTAFEAERNLITSAAGLDGGSSIAADRDGNVYASWHATIPDSPANGGEAYRAVFVASSRDEGKSFSAEKQATEDPTGACGCCGMRMFTDKKGASYILYRGAEEKLNRDEVLLISSKPGAPFKIAKRHRWKIESCPMSSAFLTQVGESVLAAWETDGQVFLSRIDMATHAISPMVSPDLGPRRKHPVAATNSKGETLLVWTEGTAWAKGGSVAWQLFDRDLKPIAKPTRVDGLPIWGLPATFAKPNGDFVVIY